MARTTPKGRPPAKVARITLDVVRSAYRHLARPHPYYVADREIGCHLRILRSEVQIGVRLDKGTRWRRVATIPPDVSIEELEALRLEARRAVREVEDEDEEPSLRDGRLLTVAALRAEFRANYLEKRGAHRSPETIAFYDRLWSCHLAPEIGELKLAEVTPRTAEQLHRKVRQRVHESRPHADGRSTANHVAAHGRTIFEYARRKGKILRNPFDDLTPYDVEPADVCLRDDDLDAVGKALRALEELAVSRDSHLAPYLSSLAALRVVIYTGVRHRVELVWLPYSSLKDPYGRVPRLELQRSKGDRGSRRGRFVYLGPDSVARLLAIARPPGSEDLLVPGRLPGRPMYRLNDVWARVLRDAAVILAHRAEAGHVPDSEILARRSPGGAVDIDVKTLRHTFRTNLPRAGVRPEHGQQLLGHRGAAVTDTVYLHENGPALAEAAARIEAFTRGLMGEGRRQAGVLEFRREGA
jgi:integrase